MLDQVSEQYWMLGYETKREATMEHPTSNPIIALWFLGREVNFLI